MLTVYEGLQRFVLRIFELTFLELIALGFPVSIATIVLSLAGMSPPMFPIMVVIFIGVVWICSYVALILMRDIWTIPIRKIGPLPWEDRK